MSWSPEDEDPPRKPRPRNSASVCGCDMCSAPGADSTELGIEDVE